MSIESVMWSKNLIFCHLLLLLPSIFPSISVFSSESVLCIRWLKYWSFSFSISLFNEYSGLISFSIDGFDPIAVQGTLESSPTSQFKSISSSVLTFLMVQLSHPYKTTGKTIALTRWNFIYVYRHICIQTYVKKSFEKEYNSILDKENKSTSIYIYFFQMCILAIMLGLKPYLQM